VKSTSNPAHMTHPLIGSYQAGFVEERTDWTEAKKNWDTGQPNGSDRPPQVAVWL